jgi:AraC-like DNA-binding protein
MEERPVHDTNQSPPRRIAFSSSDEDETEDFIRRTYVDNRTRFLAVPEGARFGAEAVVGAEAAADRVWTEVDYVARCEPWDHLCFVEVHEGVFDLRQGDASSRVAAGEHFFYPVDGDEMSVRLTNVDCVTVRMPIERLHEVATELLGARAGDVRLTGAAPVSAAAARRWSGVLTLANREILAEDTVAGQPLLQDQLLRTVAVAALHTFPNTAMAAPDAGRHAPAMPAAVRRAAAFLEDHAHRPITPLDAGEAAGLTPEALAAGFRRHLDTTPQEHLRRVRLEHAHRELQATHPTAWTTVRTIARRWGFGDPGDFAARYRAAYGRAPHRTLRS